MTRLVFFGTPEVAATTLAGIIEAGHNVALVVTGPDRRRSRRGAPTQTPVKAIAVQHGIAVSEAARDAIGCDAELGVVVAFGKLIKKEVLDALPCVNAHFSLLPRWRGAAPIERAILAGDERTGVCLMALEEGLDTGPIFARQEVVIDDEETADELRARLGDIGVALLLDKIASGPSGLGTPVAQVGEATYAAKLNPEELELDFAAGAVICHRKVRVGRAWTTFRSRRVIVVSARPRLEDVSTALPGTIVDDGVVAADGILQLVSVREEGRVTQPFATWLRGARLTEEERFGH